LSLYLSCCSHLHHRALHPFPTRRSSDLDDGSRVFPSVETLSDYLGVSDRQVRAGLSRLRDLEVLLVEQSGGGTGRSTRYRINLRSEEHTSELQSHLNLVCRLLLEKKNEK